MYKRILELNLPEYQSAFLWGARKTGKSTFLKDSFSKSYYIDLLRSDLYLKYSKEPWLFREELLTLGKNVYRYPIIVDEVQKIPILLDEVHYLIENKKLQFILCGSSARKLKRGSANLLGGRAWGYHFFPLVYPEITDFNLLKILNQGLLPMHYLSSDYNKSLMAYVHDYLSEEIQAEGIVRNLPQFARFLDSVGFSNGELMNFSNIARDCGVSSVTVKEYYQILVDTLLGYFIYPSTNKKGRDTISSVPKFYFFDVGVANYLGKKTIQDLRGESAGKAFENYILMELMAYKTLKDKNYDIKFWRTKTGLDVDFVIEEKNTIIEVKISKIVRKEDLKGTIAFLSEKPNTKAYVVSLDSSPRKLTVKDGLEIMVLPYKRFLEDLWKGKII